MALFLGIATLEAQVGKQNLLYHSYATYLQHQWGVGLNIALWLIVAAKLAFVLAGAFAISSVVYLVGSIVGKPNSRRVLYRRLAVVFTVLLAGYTVAHFSTTHEVALYVSYALYAWGMLLGYIALRAQFELSHLETSIVAVFALLMVGATWQFSNVFFDDSVRSQMQSLTKRPADKMDANQFKMGTGSEF